MVRTRITFNSGIIKTQFKRQIRQLGQQDVQQGHLTEDQSNRILQIILNNDSDKLLLLLSELDSPNSRFVGIEQRLPPILTNSPPIISVAAFFGAKNCVETLLGFDPDLTLQDLSGRTPAHFAAAGGSIEVVRILNTSKDIFTTPDTEGLFPIHYAAAYGNIDIIRYFWIQGIDINPSLPGAPRYRYSHSILRGDQPIHFAAQNGHLEAVEFFLNNGANVNIKSQYDKLTPLHCACIGGHADVITLLAKRGAELEEFSDSRLVPIVYAAQYGSLEALKALIEAGAAINRSNRKFQPVVEAAQKGHLDVVRYFIESGVNINIKNSQSYTPLHAAVEGKQPAVVSYLLKKGANWRTETKGSQISPFISACERGDPELIAPFFDIAHIDLKEIDCDKAIVAIVESGSCEGLKLLLNHGARIPPTAPTYRVHRRYNYRYNLDKGSCILAPAIESSNLEMVKLLVENGMLNEATDSEENPILLIAVNYRNFEIFKYLLDSGAKLSKELIEKHNFVYHALSSLDLDIVKHLLTFKPDLNVSGNNNDPKPLIGAIDSFGQNRFYMRRWYNGMGNTMNPEKNMSPKEIETQWLGLTELLLKNGASIPASDSPSVLELAINKGCKKLLRLLLKYGLDINAIKEINETENTFIPRRFASRFNMLRRNDEALEKEPVVHRCIARMGGKMLELILENGFRIELEDSNGVTLLMKLIEANGNNEAVNLLLDRGANVNHCNKKGETAIFYACRNGLIGVTKALIDKGVDLNKQSNSGDTPLHLAVVEEANYHLVNILLKSEANPNIRNKARETPLYMSIKSESYSIANLLLDFGADKSLLPNLHVADKCDDIELKKRLGVGKKK